MTAPRYQDIKGAEIPEVVDDDGTRVRVVCGDFWGKRVPSTASPPTRAISTCSCRRESERHSRSRSTATPLLTCSKATARSVPRRSRRRAQRERSPATRPRARGSATVAGAVRPETRSRCRPATRGSVPAGVGQADRGAGRLVRPDRHEHAGRVAASRLRSAQRNLHQGLVGRFIPAPPLFRSSRRTCHTFSAMGGLDPRIHDERTKEGRTFGSLC